MIEINRPEYVEFRVEEESYSPGPGWELVAIVTGWKEAYTDWIYNQNTSQNENRLVEGHQIPNYVWGRREESALAERAEHNHRLEGEVHALKIELAELRKDNKVLVEDRDKKEVRVRHLEHILEECKAHSHKRFLTIQMMENDLAAVRQHFGQKAFDEALDAQKEND